MNKLRHLAAVLLLIAFPSMGQAQSVPIFGHPQTATTGPVPLDGQCQWREEPAPLGIIDKAWQHTHIQLWPNLYEIINGLIRIPFNIVTRNLKGYAAVDLDRQELVTKIEWDDIGEQHYRALFGDPTGIKNWPGHITIDPHKDAGGHLFPQKGWYSPQFEVNTFYDTGSNILQLTRLPYYSMLDPTAKDGSLSGFPIYIVSCYPHTFDITEWGTNYVEVDTYLPLLPISTKWPLVATSAAYGGHEIGFGKWQILADFDIHAGKAGRVLDTQLEQNFNGANRAPVLDPATLGPGVHPVAFVWSKPTSDNTREVIALSKFTVTVDPNVPQPPTCVPPQVLVGGVCTPPVPVAPAPPVITSTLKAGDGVVRGQGVVSALIQVLVDGEKAPGEVPADGAGAWSRTVDPLAAGQVVTATQTVGGMTSAVSASVTVGAGTPPPPPPPILAGTYTFVCDAAGNCKLTLVKP